MGWEPVDVTGNCVQYGEEERGAKPYEEIPCLYPWYGKTYMDWELEFRPYTAVKFVEQNAWLPFGAVILYLILIKAGQQFMKNRPAWNFRKTLAAWNLGLSLFSFWGLSRVLPQLLHNLYHYSWRDNLCESPYSLVSQTAGIWGFFFLMSKFAELFDTFFIVVHKKKLLFLHWYHHITVLICCWHTWITATPTGLIFSVVNYGVHAVMYFYYFLMAVRCKPKWFNPKVLTIAQISQMVVGVFVSLDALNYVNKKDCEFLDLRNIQYTLLMYASYLLLFLQFFFARYGTKVSTKVKSA